VAEVPVCIIHQARYSISACLNVYVACLLLKLRKNAGCITKYTQVMIFFDQCATPICSGIAY
jgi:hypothetical protein